MSILGLDGIGTVAIVAAGRAYGVLRDRINACWSLSSSALDVSLAMRRCMAIAIRPRHMDEARVAQAVREVVSQPSYAAAAARAGQHYADVDGPGRTADALVEHLRMPAGHAVISQAQAGRAAPHFQ